MLKQYTALSVVAQNAGRIVQGQKTLEVRSWHPEVLPLKDVVIVENQNFICSSWALSNLFSLYLPHVCPQP
nr:ASCH domain-containing protein [Acinetobacter sp. A47]